VYIDPQGAVLNTVEGVLQVKDTNNAITSVIVETGGSVLTLWPIQPTYATSTKTIQFTGGTRESFSSKAFMLRVRIFSSSQDKITLSWIHGSAYLADGKGTKNIVEARSITLSLKKNFPNPINPSSTDSIPPTFDSIDTGRDDTIHDGKNFIQVVAKDNKSGIDKIEITENGIVTEAQNETYVFQEQEKDTEVLITAYDKAGNSTSLTFPGKNKLGTYLLIVVVGILLLLYLRYKYK
jgi:hypothetical protein